MAAFFIGCWAGACMSAFYWCSMLSQRTRELHDAEMSADYWEQKCAELVRREIIKEVCDN